MTPPRNQGDTTHKVQACRSDYLDIALTRWWEPVDANQTYSASEACGFKYHLYMAGNTWANRVKYLMMCGATLVMPKDPHFGFWWHLLEVSCHKNGILWLAARQLSLLSDMAAAQQHPDVWSHSSTRYLATMACLRPRLVSSRDHIPDMCALLWQLRQAEWIS